MYRYEDLALLGTTLPEDILKKKWAGDFAGALAAIDARLSGTLPEPLRAILRVERELIKRLDSHYTLSRDAALGSGTVDQHKLLSDNKANTVYTEDKKHG